MNYGVHLDVDQACFAEQAMRSATDKEVNPGRRSSSSSAELIVYLPRSGTAQNGLELDHRCFK
jgi:hypothetical protein